MKIAVNQDSELLKRKINSKDKTLASTTGPLVKETANLASEWAS